MKTLKFALLYIWSNKKKSLLLFILLLVIISFLLTASAIRRGSKDANADLRGATGGSFGIEINLNNPSNFTSKGGYNQYTGDFISEDTIDKIMDIEGVSGNNAQVEYPSDVFIGDGQKGMELIKKSKMYDNDPYFDQLVLLKISTNTQYDENFLTGAFRLTEGSHIGKDSEAEILISKELAEVNKLKVGNQLLLKQNPEEVGDKQLNKKKVRICGIYEISATQPNTDSLPACYIMENYIFTGNDVLLELEGLHDSVGSTYEKIEFFVSDPMRLGEIMEEVKRIEGVKWESFVFTTDNEAYQKSSTSIGSMDTLMTTMIYVVIIVGTLLLLLILFMWLKSRKREFGILLSLGIPKRKIVMQIVQETMLLAIAACITAFLISGTVSDYVSDYLVKAQAHTKEQETTSEMTYPWEQGLQVEPADTATIKVTLTRDDLIFAYTISFFILFVTILISTIPMLRQKPKEILTQL